MSDLVTPLVPDMIHRPEAPAHMMRAKPFGGRVRITLDGETLADTTDALQVIEIGRDVYDPVYYLPAGDVRVALEATDRTTHCPLKGDTTYYDAAHRPELAWSYTRPLPFAEVLRDRVAFDASQVEITLSPAS